MLKMRLQRIGRRNAPAFRVIVTDSRKGPKSGKHIDSIGAYNPKTGSIEIDGERAQHWIKNGVQVSDTVHNMLVEKKIIDGKKINVLPRKSPIVRESDAAESAPEPTPAAPEAGTDTDTDEQSATAPAEESSESATTEAETAPDTESAESDATPAAKATEPTDSSTHGEGAQEAESEEDTDTAKK